MRRNCLGRFVQYGACFNTVPDHHVLLAFGSADDSNERYVALAVLLFLSLFAQMSEGTSYGSIPFTVSKQLASLSTLVGAGGNLGSVVELWSFYKQLGHYHAADLPGPRDVRAFGMHFRPALYHTRSLRSAICYSAVLGERARRMREGRVAWHRTRSHRRSVSFGASMGKRARRVREGRVACISSRPSVLAEWPAFSRSSCRVSW